MEDESLLYHTRQGLTSPLSIHTLISFFIFIFCFYLAVLGLRCCARAFFFSSCGERGLLLVAVRGLLIVVASLVAEHRL